MKVLMMSYFFPPYNTIGAVRLSKIARHLIDRGHEVKVLTVDSPPLPKGLDEEISGQEVVRTPYINVNALPELALGGRGNVVSKGYSSDISALNRIGSFYKSLFNMPDGQVGWVPFAVAQGIKLCRTMKPDVIYASATPFSSLIAASIVSRISGVPWVGELRDLWLDSPSYKYGAIRRYIESRLENWVLTSSDGLVTVSAPLADILKLKYGKKVLVAMNGYDEIESYTRFKFDDEFLNIVYTGTVYAKERDPSALFESISVMGDLSSKIKVHFFGRYINGIIDSATKYGVEDQVVINGMVDRKTAVSIQKSADILLFLNWSGDGAEGIVSGKIFEYMASRRPVLGIGRGDDYATKIINELNIGIVSNDTAKIRDYLISMLDLKNEHGFIEDVESSDMGMYSRKSQNEKIEKLLMEIAND